MCHRHKLLDLNILLDKIYDIYLQTYSKTSLLISVVLLSGRKSKLS
jgi:hypothetical protein